MIGTLAVFGIVACYAYSVYLVSQGRMVHVPDEESGAPESHSVPQLVRPSSHD